ncbi:MAG: hypothetical protein U0637_01075 [Phycisphaerales bacterium]
MPQNAENQGQQPQQQVPFDDGAGVGGPSGRDVQQAAQRGCVVDRRSGLDRRDVQARLRGENPDDPNNPFKADDFNRRRGPGRRLSDRLKAAEEGELTKEQFLFLMAIDSFKKANSVAFPSWTDVLEVIRLLGYRKTMAMELTLTSAEDWREAANAPSSVRSPRWERHVKKDSRDAA